MRTLGRRGEKKNPLSQKSKIFASSPEGRAKASFDGTLPDKLQFLTCIHLFNLIVAQMSGKGKHLFSQIRKKSFPLRIY